LPLVITYTAALLFLFQPFTALSHPLKLSLSEIEYSEEEELLTVNLRLFLTDVNEALVFDPESTELRFCQPDEPPTADLLLLDYLNNYFYIEANGEQAPLEIKTKKLKGEGLNTALGVTFEHPQKAPLKSLKIKNAVFTDLFYDQTNIIYIHVNGDSTSLMLNKKTPIHTLVF
jgi:hypothetical protein